MKSIFSNWQTTAAGVIVIALGAANTFLGIHVPGFSLDFVAALPVGVGLIFAKDAANQNASPAPTGAAMPAPVSPTGR
jgi:hypothetical protein